MGYLTAPESLHLDNNSLSGELPLSLQNCSGLMTLDLNMNAFKGKLPTWIGSYTFMQFLTIRSNRFEGEIPKELCLLTSLRILDIAHNNFSGTIPSCFKNFTAMSIGGEINDSFFGLGKEYESITVVTKDRGVAYEITLTSPSESSPGEELIFELGNVQFQKPESSPAAASASKPIATPYYVLCGEDEEIKVRGGSSWEARNRITRLIPVQSKSVRMLSVSYGLLFSCIQTVHIVVYSIG
ncbi:Leucine-rich repeat [Dillenia turbinata]|uniref:Leucine-rich repeat n=1 Tax=Dillenia turbinata TaxID=194707 RepID=A0AAN8W646_9MAGN